MRFFRIGFRFFLEIWEIVVAGWYENASSYLSARTPCVGLLVRSYITRDRDTMRQQNSMATPSYYSPFIWRRRKDVGWIFLSVSLIGRTDRSGHPFMIYI